MMMRPAWINAYIEIPFMDGGRTMDGCDCYGLVRLVLMEQFGVTLESYADCYDTTRDAAAIARTVARRAEVGWCPVPAPPYQAGDVGLFRLRGQPVHVGVLVNSREMLHIQKHTEAIVEPIAAPEWVRRLEGIYRYAG